MVPLSALTKIRVATGPRVHHALQPVPLGADQRHAAPGYSSAQAMAALEEVFEQTMPREMGYDYMGMSFQERKPRRASALGSSSDSRCLFVFLILAALYESWSLPFSVLLSTPVAVFGAFGVLWLRRSVLAPSSCRLTWCRSKTTCIRRSAW